MSWAIINAGMLNITVEKEQMPIVQNPEQPAPTEKTKLDQCREERLETVLSIEVKYYSTYY